MQETRVRFLGWEDPLEKELATHSIILAWRIPMDRGPWQATVHGVAKVGHDSAPKPPPPPNIFPKFPATSVRLSNFKFFLNRHLLSPLVKYGGERVMSHFSVVALLAF